MPQLEIDIVAHFAKFQDTLTEIVRSVDGFKKKFEGLDGAFKFAEKAAGLIGVGLGFKEIAEQIGVAIEKMDLLGRTSERTGIAVEELGKLKFAASVEGVDFESLVHGIDKFNKAIDESSGAFHRLKLDPATFTSTEDALEQTAERFAKLENGAGKTALAISLFGKAGAELIPFLNRGSAGLKELFERAEKLGLIPTKAQTDQARQYTENLAILHGSVEATTQVLANALVPALINVSNAFIKGVDRGGLFVGVLSSIAQASKNLFFGLDNSPLDAQKKDVETAQKELEILLELRERVNKGARINPASLEKLDQRILQAKIHVGELVTGLNNLERPVGAIDKEKPPKPFIGQSELDKAKLQNILEDVKQFNSQQQQLDDIAFAHGEQSLSEHYDRRLERIKNGIQKEIAATRASLNATQKELGDADTEDQRKPLRARAETLRGQLGRLNKQLSFAPEIATAEEKAALDAFKDSIEEINIALLRQTGRAGDAADAESNLTRVMEQQEKIRKQFGDDSEELRAFQRQQHNIKQQGDLTDALQKEAATATDLNAQEQEAQAAYVAAGSSLEAYAKLLEDVNRIKRESIDETLRQIKVEEDLIIATTDAGSNARDAGLATIRTKRAAVELVRADTSPQNLASRKFGTADSATNLELEKEQIKEEAIQNRLIAGEITTQDALRETDRVRQESIATLREKLAVEQALALESGKDEDLLRAERTGLALQRLAATANEVSKQTRDVFESAFVNPFEDFVKGVKSADDALKSFFQNIAAGLLHIASQHIAEALFNNLFGTAKGGDSSAGFLGLFSSFFGQGLSSGGTTATGVVGLSGGGAVGSANGNIMTSSGPLPLSRYAGGGIARRPQLSLFGEGRLPEAYVPLPDGRSIPVTVSGSSGAQIQAGPSAIVARQQSRAPSVTLQLHPDAMQLTLRDWFEGEMARTLATR